jgi:hypothetical protein
MEKKTLKNNNTNLLSLTNRDFLSGKQSLLLIPLTQFYSNKYNIKKLKDILDGVSKLSLRLVDWFVTNYSKKNCTYYNLEKYHNKYDINKKKTIKKNIDDFDNYLFVFNNYRSQLKSFNKKNFDPFCRRERIKFFYNETKKDYIITTIGQLNFFQWAIENKILEYIEENIDDIETDMNECSNIKKYSTEKTKKKEKKPRKKRKELSISSSKSFMIHNFKTTISFN